MIPPKKTALGSARTLTQGLTQHLERGRAMPIILQGTTDTAGGAR